MLKWNTISTSLRFIMLRKNLFRTVKTVSNIILENSGVKKVSKRLACTAKFEYSYSAEGFEWKNTFTAAAVLFIAMTSSVLSDESAVAHSDSVTGSGRSYPIFRRSEVATHTTKDTGIWVTYKGGVYDVTEFVANHPGGSEKWRLLKHQFHFKSPLAFELLEEMRIGTVHKDDIIHFDSSMLETPLRKYPTNKIYDCIIIGSGISGLQTAHSLVDTHGIQSDNVLVLEAQDYVGGRVKQISDFIRGVDVDVGAEFLHGSNTLLTKFAEENNQPISELFCWYELFL